MRSIGFPGSANVSPVSSAVIYTVGHSNREQVGFLDLLKKWRIRALVDIRALPRSRRHPQFDSEVLRGVLPAADIAYHWAGRQLGGMREPEPGSLHTALQEGLRGYADHMGSAVFRQGVAQLMRLAATRSTAVMCAEKEPLQCHRSLLADHLVLVHGIEVRHLLSTDEMRSHRPRPEARLDGGRTVYDRYAQAQLEI